MKEKVLILGGTEFVGRLLVEALIREGTKELYLFNRGKTNPDLFPEVKRIIGDRETSDIEKIANVKWDYIIDFSSYFPKSLQATLDQINKDVKKYIYISTISVYDFNGYAANSPIDENYPKVGCTSEQAIESTLKYYGNKKAACEEVLANTKWLNAIILRPSIIYGRFDPTDRFYYWFKKIKAGGSILIPNNGEDGISLTYADDLVDLIVNAIDNHFSLGAYNCSTHDVIPFKNLLKLLNRMLGTTCEFYGIAPGELRVHKHFLPLAAIGNININNSKLKAATDLEWTVYEDTLQSLIEFYDKEGWRPTEGRMTKEDESEMIKKYQLKPLSF